MSFPTKFDNCQLDGRQQELMRIAQERDAALADLANSKRMLADRDQTRNLQRERDAALADAAAAKRILQERDAADKREQELRVAKAERDAAVNQANAARRELHQAGINPNNMPNPPPGTSIRRTTTSLVNNVVPVVPAVSTYVSPYVTYGGYVSSPVVYDTGYYYPGYVDYDYGHHHHHRSPLRAFRDAIGI